MTATCVLGSGGLLGAALCRALRRTEADLFHPAERFCWDNVPVLSTQIAAAAHAFASQVGPADQWEIYWAAGVGTLSSTAESFVPETHALTLLLQLLQADPRLMATPGAIAFASSAGAIYAGSAEEIITENTAPAPTTAYAREKRRQEDLVRTFVCANSRATALIARISTLYGPSQATSKKQGLMTHIARCILRNQPIQIYVPYDTIRDYLTADDAATRMIGAVRGTREQPRAAIQIIASENPVTIAEIISIFRRISRRKPRVVTSASKLSALYARRVQFRSIVAPPPAPPRTLVVGIAQLLTAERAVFVRSAGDEVK